MVLNKKRLWQAEVNVSQPVFIYRKKEEGSMKSSNIGGQAVLEGIMMKNKTRYAVAVRKPDQQIEVCVKEYKGIIPWQGVYKVPFIRGIFNFIDSLVLGMKTLTYSASFFEEEEGEVLTEQEAQKQEKQEKIKIGRAHV